MTAPPRPAGQQAALAAQAREAQRCAPVHSLRRKAWGVVAVLLDSTRTIPGARLALGRHRLPEDVRACVEQLLDGLEAKHPHLELPAALSPDRTRPGAAGPRGRAVSTRVLQNPSGQVSPELKRPIEGDAR